MRASCASAARRRRTVSGSSQTTRSSASTCRTNQASRHWSSTALRAAAKSPVQGTSTTSAPCSLRHRVVRPTEPVSPTTTRSTRPSRLARQSPSMASSSRTIRVATSSGRPSGPTPVGELAGTRESCAATAPSATTTGSVHRRTIARGRSGGPRPGDGPARGGPARTTSGTAGQDASGRSTHGDARAHEPQSVLQEVRPRTRSCRARCCGGSPGRRWRDGPARAPPGRSGVSATSSCTRSTRPVASLERQPAAAAGRRRRSRR